jgi:hypothetical protein
MRLALSVQLALSVLVLAPAPAPANDGWPPGVEQSIGALERALRDHDYAAVEGLLAPGFRYAGHGGALARSIMQQVVAGYPDGLIGVEIGGVREEPDGTLTVEVALHTPAGVEEHPIRLSREGRILEAEVARIQLAGHEPQSAAPGPRDTDAWSLSLDQPVVRVPFELRESFPVPLVEVFLGDHGPYLFAVDTAAACTVLLRRRLADELALEAVGTAAVGDASGRPTRPAELVRLPDLRLGGVVARDLVAVSHSPSAAHAASIPDDTDGILGRVLFESLLLTLDYPGRRLVLREGRLEPGPLVTPFELVQGVMQVNVDVAGRLLPVLLDSGHRGTVTLPASWAERLPLDGPLVDAGQTATVNVTYRRRRARLEGAVEIAGARIESPTLFFTDEHTPSLLGGGLLQAFTVTIDQVARLVRFERAQAGRLADTGSP